MPIEPGDSPDVQVHSVFTLGRCPPGADGCAMSIDLFSADAVRCLLDVLPRRPMSTACGWLFDEAFDPMVADLASIAREPPVDDG